jgi:phosphohistidine phosphatase
MHKIFLLRHGKAANGKDGQDDFDRPLNKKGVAQINLVGRELNIPENNIGLIISSSALRTKETTEIVNYHLNTSKIKFDKNIYLAPPDVILDHVKETADCKEVLYIGHNFGIADFANYLTGESITMSTGMLVEISLNIENWSQLDQNTGIITKMFVPKTYVP